MARREIGAHSLNFSPWAKSQFLSSSQTSILTFVSLSPRTIIFPSKLGYEFFKDLSVNSSGLSSKRIILSPFTKEFRGEGHSYESLNFSGATFVAVLTQSTSNDGPPILLASDAWH